MKQSCCQDQATVATIEDIGLSDRSSSSADSSLSPRRPQEFYYDIEVTPTTKAKISVLQAKKVKNRLRAFELASRVLRDEPVVEYDPLDAFSRHRHTSDQERNSHLRPASYHETQAKVSSEMLDVGNNSDSMVLQMRREALRRESITACDPSRSCWGDLTHHRSPRVLPTEPKTPPRYPRKFTKP